MLGWTTGPVVQKGFVVFEPVAMESVLVGLAVAGALWGGGRRVLRGVRVELKVVVGGRDGGDQVTRVKGLGQR